MAPDRRAHCPEHYVPDPPGTVRSAAGLGRKRPPCSPAFVCIRRWPGPRPSGPKIGPQVTGALVLSPELRVFPETVENGRAAQHVRIAPHLSLHQASRTSVRRFYSGRSDGVTVRSRGAWVRTSPSVAGSGLIPLALL